MAQHTNEEWPTSINWWKSCSSANDSLGFNLCIIFLFTYQKIEYVRICAYFLEKNRICVIRILELTLADGHLIIGLVPGSGERICHTWNPRKDLSAARHVLSSSSFQGMSATYTPFPRVTATIIDSMRTSICGSRTPFVSAYRLSFRRRRRTYKI